MESEGSMIFSPVRLHHMYDRIDFRAIQGMTEEDIHSVYWGLMKVHVPLHEGVFTTAAIQRFALKFQNQRNVDFPHKSCRRKGSRPLKIGRR
jgi:hypothetical protein